MKTLYWDSTDPLDVWGNPNLRWGDPSYRLEPGDAGYVEWFPPGTTPPAPEPKPKRRSLPPPEPLLSNLTNPNMSQTLLYDVVARPGGKSTTRVVNREDITTDQLCELAVTELAAMGQTFTAAQVTAVGVALSKVKIAKLAEGHVIRRAFDYYTEELDTGGIHDSPDFTPTNESMSPSLTARLAPQGQALLESLITYERRQVAGQKLPIITRIYDAAMRECDCISLGKSFRLGSDRAFGPEEPDAANAELGLFLTRTGGTPVRLSDFSHWTDSEICGAWPAAISGTGDVEVKLVVRYPKNASNSVFTYGKLIPITP